MPILPDTKHSHNLPAQCRFSEFLMHTKLNTTQTLIRLKGRHNTTDICTQITFCCAFPIEYHAYHKQQYGNQEFLIKFCLECFKLTGKRYSCIVIGKMKRIRM